MQPVSLPVFALLAALVFGNQGGAASQPQEAAMRPFMAAYYAALLSSSHGNAEATSRHLIRMQSRWASLMDQQPHERGGWMGEKSGGRPVTESIASQIEMARKHLPRDVAGAHAELEAIRIVLRDARARRGQRTFDDVLTDYHEAIERLASRLGARNEMVLTAGELESAREQAEVARRAWAAVQAYRPQPVTSAGWRDLSTRTDAAIGAAIDATSSRDAGKALAAMEIVKNLYYDVLRLLSGAA